MKMELQILDWIQQMRTAGGRCLDGVYFAAWKCRNDLDSVYMPAAYDSADEKMGSCAGGSALSGCDHLQYLTKAYGLPDPSVRCESDNSAAHCPPGGLFLPVGTYGGFVCCGRGSVLCRGEKMVENHAASGDPDGVFKNVFICALPDRCFGRHDCGMRGGVFWKPAGGASDTVLETEDEKTRGQKK